MIASSGSDGFNFVVGADTGTCNGTCGRDIYDCDEVANCDGCGIFVFREDNT